MRECQKCGKPIEHDEIWGWLHEEIVENQSYSHRTECPVVPQ